MDFKMLESFNESTLKQMIIDLHAENKKLKDEENKAVEEKQKEIWKLMDQVTRLEIDLKISKDSYEKIWEKSHHIPEIQIVQWMEQNCIEADNITDKKGMLRAPTDLNTLYDNYIEWCLEEETDGTFVSETDKKTFKTQLFHWQKESKYGLSIGKKKSDSEGMVNGYPNNPYFNLRII